MTGGYQKLYEDLFAARRAEEKAKAAKAQLAGTAFFGGEEPAPPHNGTATSIAAADAIADQLGRLELLVLRGVIGLGTATTEELEESLMLPGNTVRPRIWSLRKKGFVRDMDGTRTTKSGRQAQVHTATPAGLDAALQATADHRRKAA